VKAGIATILAAILWNVMTYARLYTNRGAKEENETSKRQRRKNERVEE
jgi:hypothetical protein